ncbi:unnamed protein product, partial [Urochloa humidicola]
AGVKLATGGTELLPAEAAAAGARPPHGSEAARDIAHLLLSRTMQQIGTWSYNFIQTISWESPSNPDMLYDAPPW